jgi:hypothetical protein
VGIEKSYGALERKTEGFDGRGKMDLEQKKINSIKRDLKTNFFIELKQVPYNHRGHHPSSLI